MKHLNYVRSYRNFCKPASGETTYQVVIEQSDLFVTSRVNLKSEVLDRLNKIRQDIKGYIFLHPEFATSLNPIQENPDAPEIIKNMIRAGRIMDVGPMAAVAGAISQDIADFAVRLSPDILVENGGDIFIHSTKDRVVGLLPHPDEPAVVGIKIDRGSTPCAICASSATIGHSLSLGNGDLVVVKSKSGAVADAAATALCNIMKNKKSITKLNRLRNDLEKKGILGVLAQMGDNLSVWGDMELTVL
ncbi:MAG: UPF0280 family protein [Desulfonatronovibrio sp. MSAO_Bac4]|nr:MAG: UPF0280 family protein [Desulfonatronovibrio sp. MSAO_Bac4]